MVKKMASFKCSAEGCTEWGHIEADNKKDYLRLVGKYFDGKWKCVRHSAPDEILSLKNKVLIKILIAEKPKEYPNLSELYWDNGHGFVYGPGFKAYSDDFPQGTKLIITAEIIVPEQIIEEEGSD